MAPSRSARILDRLRSHAVPAATPRSNPRLSTKEVQDLGWSWFVQYDCAGLGHPLDLDLVAVAPYRDVESRRSLGDVGDLGRGFALHLTTPQPQYSRVSREMPARVPVPPAAVSWVLTHGLYALRMGHYHEVETFGEGDGTRSWNDPMGVAWTEDRGVNIVYDAALLPRARELYNHARKYGFGMDRWIQLQTSGKTVFLVGDRNYNLPKRFEYDITHLATDRWTEYLRSQGGLERAIKPVQTSMATGHATALLLAQGFMGHSVSGALIAAAHRSQVPFAFVGTATEAEILHGFDVCENQHRAVRGLPKIEAGPEALSQAMALQR